VAGIWGICNSSPPWPVNGVLIPGIPVADEVTPPTFPPELSRQIAPMNLSNVTEVSVDHIDSCREYLDFNLARTLEVTKQVYTVNPLTCSWRGSIRRTSQTISSMPILPLAKRRGCVRRCAA
jgi:hypothetical protein